MTRNDSIRFVVLKWMKKNTYPPVHNLDEDGDVDGRVDLQRATSRCLAPAFPFRSHLMMAG